MPINSCLDTEYIWDVCLKWWGGEGNNNNYLSVSVGAMSFGQLIAEYFEVTRGRL